MTLFVFLVAAFWCLFNIFTANDHFHIFKKIFQAKTNQNRTNKPKRLLSFKNLKLFGSLQLLVISEHTWEPLIPYIGFMLRTIYHTKFEWRSFPWRNGMASALKFLVFLWFLSTFCSDFFFSLSEETEFFLFSLGSLFCYLYFLDVLWNSYQSLLILLTGERCLIWRFRLVYLFILN